MGSSIGSIKIFGQDLDDLLAYNTPKFVRIRDWKLGFMQKLLMFLIVLKIFFFQMVWQGKHLKPVRVQGLARASLQQPTRDGCDPLETTCFTDWTPLDKLPYCNQYNGTVQVKKKANCVIRDGITMQHGRTAVPGTIFLPTRITTVHQKSGCEPNKANGWKCISTTDKTKKGGKPFVYDGKHVHEDDIMPADLDRFTLLIAHGWSTEDKKGTYPAGRGTAFEAFLKPEYDPITHQHVSKAGHEQKIDKKIQAKDGSVWPMQEAKSHEGFEKTFNISAGDVFSIGDLMRIADPRGENLLDADRVGGSTMRWDGGAIAITITYDNHKNLDPLGWHKPHYTIEATFMPLRTYKIMDDTITPTGRKIENTHGILITMTVQGVLRQFDLNHMLMMLTTAMVSLSMAALATDFFMCYFPFWPIKPNGPNYTMLKFQPSCDFSSLAKKEVTVREKCKLPEFDRAEASCKTSHHAHCLHKCVTKALAGDPQIVDAPKDADLLHILMIFEQRLNRLDGLDPTFATLGTATFSSQAKKGDDTPAKKFVEQMEIKHTKKHKDGEMEPFLGSQ